MKINDQNTALHFLEKGTMSYSLRTDDIGQWDNMRVNMLRTFLDHGFATKRELYKKKIQYISDPFLAAYESAKSRLTLSLVTDHDHMQESGTIIVRRDDGGRNTVFYTVTVGKDDKGVTELKGSLIVFGTDHYKRTKLPVLMLAYIKTPTGEPWQYVAPGSEWSGMQPGDKVEALPFAIWVDIVYMLIFMRYCEVETKMVAPGRKQEHVGQKYINDTRQPIEIVDSTWFTTIIRSEGFGVKGHFRLQPFGPGMSQRKLVYIKPFEKHGYTRKAKILSNGYQGIGETEGPGKDQGLHGSRGQESGQDARREDAGNSPGDQPAEASGRVEGEGGI